MRTTCFGLIFMLLCVSCGEHYDHEGKTPLVELNGNFLYREDLQSVLPPDLSKDDSLLFAENYIRIGQRIFYCTIRHVIIYPTIKKSINWLIITEGH